MKPSINSELLESKMILAGFKSRKSFAEALGVSEHSVSNLLNRVYNPSFELMNKIYLILDLKPDEGQEIFFGNYLRNTKVSVVWMGWTSCKKHKKLSFRI